ncbi:MAG TPA: glucose 1-dehydrogenase [Gemmataceae bacterium]|nr:glucose 1-dehydrogenase [Gemmataceae bacterium]
MTDFNLTGRKALVTGASRGIGLAIAQGLAERGASLAITGRKADSLEAAAEQLRSGGAGVLPIVCHQGDPAAIAGLFAELDSRNFVADIVVINAATNPVMGPLAEIELQAWQKIIDVNLTGALVTAQHSVRRMLPLKRGSLVFVASIAGIDPMPGLGAYSVSKAGMIGMVKALAKELGPARIRVNAVAPGLVETRFSSALFQDRAAYERIMAQLPLGRHGQPEDVVGAVVFLASEASAYITGQVLIVDGGGRV